MNIENLQNHVEILLRRTMTRDEILVMGIAFIEGMVAERHRTSDKKE